MSRSAFSSLCILAGLCILHSHCALIRKDEASTRPIGEMAVLKLQSDSILYISNLDEKRQWRDVKDQLELSPGIHTVSFNFHKSRIKGPAAKMEAFDLSFDARPGGRYQIEFNASKDYSKWSACIMDTIQVRRVSVLITDSD